MTTRAVCLTPVRIVPGARLARPVLRADGNVLLAAGAELDREQLAHLWERGVEYVFIEVEDGRDEAARAADLAATEARVRHLFRGPGNDARNDLRQAVLDYRCGEVR